ncbi:hypothetical protein ACFWNK_03845 [Streptomyces sp. NPDC058417]|uniref:hypothetical protein n=1 Tax=unclassified Streptomyces TaxID=2593676 RepID=UPI003655D3B1
MDALAVTVTRHRYEAFLQGQLAEELSRASVEHLGADPACSVSLSTLLHGPTPPPSPGSPHT